MRALSFSTGHHCSNAHTLPTHLIRTYLRLTYSRAHRQAVPHSSRSLRQLGDKIAVGCRACQQPADDVSPADDAPGAVEAGIPVSSEVLTAPGQRLLAALQGDVSHFVSCVEGELEELRAPLGAAGADSEGPDRIASARLRAVCEDLIYCWALAEAYTSDPQLRQDMLRMLGRKPDALLSEGTDRKLLCTSVRFLSGIEGQYQLGSVQYSRQDEDPPAAEAAAPSMGADSDIRPALDPVIASVRGQMLLATEGSNPTRLDRDNAAQTYATFSSWGYWSRRMQVRRQLNLESQFESSPAIVPDPDAPLRSSTSFGDTTAVGRIFERMPAELSDFRTPEAAAVSDRHLRALFGDRGGEALTTLSAFFTMCDEARAVGRSLFDAEQVVLNHLKPLDDRPSQD